MLYKLVIYITCNVLFMVYFIHKEIFFANNISLVKVPSTFNVTTHMVSFGSSKYQKGLERITKQALAIPLFNTVTAYNETYPAHMKQFLKTHQQFYKQNPRGFGYWSWKPFIVLDKMNQVNENDIIVYLDVGCVLYSNKEAMEELRKSLWLTTQHDLLGLRLPVHPNAHWTKGDTFLELNCTTYKCKYAKQIEATLFLIKNTPKMREFIKLWIYYAFKENGHFITDAPSVKYANEPGFVEHRHDQSIFSLLIYTRLNGLAFITNDFAWNCVTNYSPTCWVASSRSRFV